MRQLILMLRSLNKIEFRAEKVIRSFNIFPSFFIQWNSWSYTGFIVEGHWLRWGIAVKIYEDYRK